jgi:signal transduction histidine kinase
MFIIMAAFEAVLIIFSDVPPLRAARSAVAWLPIAYLCLHAGLFLCAVSFLAYSPLALGRLARSGRESPAWLLPVVMGGLLSMVAAIAGLDQLRSTQISAFIANILIAGTFVLVQFPMSAGIFAVVFAIFVGGVFLFQNDSAVRFAHLVNGGLFSVMIVLISKFIYDAHFDNLAKTRLLEEANARLDSLNADLELRVEQRTGELRLARDAAEAANRAKTAFLGVMSHELRTPLNGVFMAVELLRKRLPQEPEQLEYADMALTTGRRLLQMVEGVLEYSALDRDLTGGMASLEAVCSELSGRFSVRERIFEPFMQLKETYLEHALGSGLGLTLARRQAEMHGGRLWAESDGEGKGSRFMLVLPLAKGEQAPGPEQAAADDEAGWTEAIGAVRQELLRACRETLERADILGLKAVLNGSAATHPAVARRLLELADNYQYEEIARLLKAGGGD